MCQEGAATVLGVLSWKALGFSEETHTRLGREAAGTLAGLLGEPAPPCPSLPLPAHWQLIIRYFLNVFMSYQPVTCSLNTPSSCGCQGFLSRRTNQNSIVSIFSLLSASLPAAAKVGCEAGELGVGSPTAGYPHGVRGSVRNAGGTGFM